MVAFQARYELQARTSVGSYFKFDEVEDYSYIRIVHFIDQDYIKYNVKPTDEIFYFFDISVEIKYLK